MPTTGKRVALSMLALVLLVGCGALTDSPGPTGSPFSLDGGPIGVDIDQTAFTVSDGNTPVRITVMTEGPNPPGSPASCAGPALPASLRYVPVYVNATPVDTSKPAPDLKVTLVITSEGSARPLQLVTDYSKYQAACPSTPVLRFDRMDANTQVILRGVAVVSDQAAATVTITVTEADGKSQQAGIKV